jgi:hypothetical protein
LFITTSEKHAAIFKADIRITNFIGYEGLDGGLGQENYQIRAMGCEGRWREIRSKKLSLFKSNREDS